MKIRKYLFDTNIVINIWRDYPDLLRCIEKGNYIDFKISHEVAKELSRKEFKNYNGVQVLSERFIELFNHILKEENIEIHLEDSVKFVKNNKTSIYSIDNNKLSFSDFNLICICSKYKELILVTEDKRIIKSAELILDPGRVINFNEFLDDISDVISI